MEPPGLLRGKLFASLVRGDVSMLSKILVDVKQLSDPSSVLEDIEDPIAMWKTFPHPMTPLQMAIVTPFGLPDERGENRRRIVGLLLLAGARADCETRGVDESPAHLAARHDLPECLALAIRFGGASDAEERHDVLRTVIARSAHTTRHLESAEIILRSPLSMTRDALEDTDHWSYTNPFCAVLRRPSVPTAARLGFIELFLRAGAIDVVEWEDESDGRRPIDYTIAGSPEESLLLSAGSRPRGETLVID